MARRRSPLQSYVDLNRRNAEQVRKVGQAMRGPSGSRWRGTSRDVTFHLVISEDPPFWRRHLQGIVILVGLVFLAVLAATGQLAQ